MNSDGHADPTALEQRLHHIDAVHFVHHALKHARRDPDLQSSGQITGEGLCRVLLELAVDEFGAEGAQVLKDWNVYTSEDVELIIQRMIEAEVLEASWVDQETDFSGWFDLNHPAEQWRLTW